MSRHLLSKKYVNRLYATSVRKTNRHAVQIVYGINQRLYSSFRKHYVTENGIAPRFKLHITPSRRTFMGGLLPTFVRGVLKIRYLVLGSAATGTYSLSKYYEEWKAGLPDIEWIRQLLPSSEDLSGVDSVQKAFFEKYSKFSAKLSGTEMDPILKSSLGAYDDFKLWFDQRLSNAIQVSENETKSVSTADNVDLGKSRSSATSRIFFLQKLDAEKVKSTTNANGDDESTRLLKNKNLDAKRQIENLQLKLTTTQEELMRVQIRYQKEIEKLEKANAELKKRLLLKSNDVKSSKKLKKCLIDLYSEVLDELSGYDSTYNTADHLPRVVVIGDQSSGKTSVLEMIAQARIFPRGGGEMMTRAPVKVTLSEGPYHIATFKDSNREFDLTSESDLQDLRREVEIRMVNSVLKDHTISSDVISMSVKGPGLQRMVLVDLPGIISTVTKGMTPQTRSDIRKLAETYMSNPNAIILCIQDGSVDAERSNVTDIVARMDPEGRRTLFVLTKVDLAEKHLTSPGRIQKILSGQLFPMKALGYFAVVTGKGERGQTETISEIREYEENFFANSKIFVESGLINTSQVTTKNLSFAVSDCFWKMVKDTVEQQADVFKATRFNLETEWKNNYPRMRQLDRDELFEKVKGEVLDQVVSISHISPHIWDEMIYGRLWDNLQSLLFDNVYFPAAISRFESLSGSIGSGKMISTFNKTNSFNTTVDIKLKSLTENKLNTKSISVGWQTLQEMFKKVMNSDAIEDGTFETSKFNKSRNGMDICDEALFEKLKMNVINTVLSKHVWEDKATDMLRIVQSNTLEDRNIKDKSEWNEAVKFLKETLETNINKIDQTLRDKVGAGLLEQWLYWRPTPTKEQSMNDACRLQLEKMLTEHCFPSENVETETVVSRPTHNLTSDELNVIKRNVHQKSKGEYLSDETIRNMWRLVYKKFVLSQALSDCLDCSKSYVLYSRDLEMLGGSDCSDVILFWRLQQMLKVTTNALRQQLINRESRRLEQEVKEVLDDISNDEYLKKELITGRRVEIAEELKKVRMIQEKLEAFIKALNSSDSS